MARAKEFVTLEGLNIASIARRFHAAYVKVESGCWEWQRNPASHGYGVIGVSGYVGMTAHRVSWLLHNGPISGGLFVLHTCDNRLCVNPEHLYLGLWKENMRDCMARGRACHNIRAHITPEVERRRIASLPRGAAHHRGSAKLTAERAMEIYRAPGTQRALAEQFSICQQTVSLIKLKKRWGFIHGAA